MLSYNDVVRFYPLNKRRRTQQIFKEARLMEIEYIKRYKTLCQCMNFCKAAEQLFISQPTLTHTITAIEKELGIQLLTRTTKAIKLTASGEKFLAAATEIICIYDRVTAEIQSASDTLDIGYISPTSDSIFAAWVLKFRKICPNTEVNILRFRSSEIENALKERRIHLGFLFKNKADEIPGIKYRIIGSQKWMVVVNKEHPFAKLSEIELSQLKDEPFLICTRSAAPKYYDQILSVCAKRGYSPKIRQTVQQVGDLARLADAGIGVAILSYSQTRSYDALNVNFINIKGGGEDLENSVVAAWNDKLSPSAKLFLDVAVEKRGADRAAETEN